MSGAIDIVSSRGGSGRYCSDVLLSAGDTLGLWPLGGDLGDVSRHGRDGSAVGDVAYRYGGLRIAGAPVLSAYSPGGAGAVDVVAEQYDSVTVSVWFNWRASGIKSSLLWYNRSILRIDANGAIRYFPNYTTGLYSTDWARDDAWHYLVGTHEGGEGGIGRCAVYLDGALLTESDSATYWLDTSVGGHAIKPYGGDVALALARDGAVSAARARYEYEAAVRGI